MKKKLLFLKNNPQEILHVRRSMKDCVLLQLMT